MASVPGPLGALVVYLALLTAAVCSLENLETDRQLDSAVCTARRFCTAERAVEELMREHSLTRELAQNVTDYTHNTSGIQWNGCSCSPACRFTNNCCADSKSLPIPDSLQKVKPACVFDDWKLVAVVKSCPASGSPVPDSVRKWCEDGHPNGGELVRMTSVKTYITYANLYCAMCRGESMYNLKQWSFKMLCLPEIRSHYAVNSSSEGNKSLSEIGSDNQCSTDEKSPQVPHSDLDETISSTYGFSLSPSSSQNKICLVYDGIVSICPSGTSKAVRKQCTEGATSYVTTTTHPSAVYRNPACATCNNIKRDALKCQVCDPGKRCKNGNEVVDRGFGLTRFSILVQPYSSDDAMACQAENDGAKCSGSLASVPKCNIGEYLDTNTVRCVPLCPLGTVLFKGSCVMKQKMRSSSCDHMVTYKTYLSIGRASRATMSRYYMNGFYLDMNNGTVFCHTCTRTVATEHKEGLTFYNNGSATMNTTMVDSLFISQDENMTYVCLPTTPTVTNPLEESLHRIQRYQDWLTLILCIISICCLMLFFLAFCFIKRMRNIPGSTIAGNMLMFLLAYVTFLARGFNEHSPNETGCYVLAVLVNYFFIAAFIFMIIYAVLIIRSLEFVDLDSRYTPITVAKIWIGGMLLPFIVIAPALLLDHYIPYSTWSPGYGGKHCFMRHREGNIVFFTAPIAACLLVAIVIYVIVVHRLRQIAAATSRVRESHKEKVFLCFKLLVVLGFNWLSGVLVAAVDRGDYPVASEILSTIFIVLCCLHGFFGFIVFVASGSNIQLIKAKYSKLTDSSSSADGGRAIRTYSGQVQSSTAVSELSTMIRKSPKASPKGSPAVLTKFADCHKDSNNGYNSMHSTLTPQADSGIGEEKHDESPLSTRSTGSKKCDFF